MPQQKKWQKELLQGSFEIHHQETDRNLCGRCARQLCHDSAQAKSPLGLAKFPFHMIMDRLVGRCLLFIDGRNVERLSTQRWAAYPNAMLFAKLTIGPCAINLDNSHRYMHRFGIRARTRATRVDTPFTEDQIDTFWEFRLQTALAVEASCETT